MALPDLASTADLTARGVTTTAAHSVMLAVASSLVRAAAGGPILEADSTVTLWGLDETSWLPLPGSPVTAVASVTCDAVALDADAYKLIDGSLWRADSWGGCEPVEIVVSLTAGLPVVPPHIVQLVCDLAILGAAAAPDGAHDPRVVAEKIDDYAVTFAQGAAGVASAMSIPKLTALWLRSQFGGGVSMVTSR